MLNPRSQPIYQESDRLRVGEFVVDVPRREVVADNGHEPTRLTIKSLHVLLALAGQQGKVVSREALLEWVWPDTLPTDDVLTQAIGQLRKAFADDRDAPRYLETISKGGYRLLAPVEWLDNAASPSITDAALAESPAVAYIAPSSPARDRRRVRTIAAIAVVGIVGAAALWYFVQRAPVAHQAVPVAGPAATEPPLPFVTITSRPGRETDASLSPGRFDGCLRADRREGSRHHRVADYACTCRRVR